MGLPKVRDLYGVSVIVLLVHTRTMSRIFCSINVALLCSFVLGALSTGTHQTTYGILIVGRIGISRWFLFKNEFVMLS
ncbi:hypothetical protein NSE_0193 [Neorickettsia sennetsu str. Miyayama]|uniref:Uncharacterized protein n=1 Tax=Ehrlichia sennetsu (strain ATCC VR-367 / Miyayama) TaxID=222891 RepID=Q2GEK8_EHRS3|nr:hypothetical protein NSE_0193 [Neorickettsia sennetsu str. Miyayama]